MAQISGDLPIVAIVGRPNVGKSTLFNWLARDTQQIIFDTPGVTRDRKYLNVRVQNKAYTIVDTPGFEFEQEHQLSEAIISQLKAVLEQADAVIWLTDARDGVVNREFQIAELVRGLDKPVIVAANKAESEVVVDQVNDFYRLGVSYVVPVSAKQGKGILEIFAHIFALLPPYRQQQSELLGVPPSESVPAEDKPIGLAIIGRPNVGKSSFINRLLGEERIVVSDMPGTTMDAVDTHLVYNNHQYNLVDTAGIRRKRSVGQELEKIAISRSLEALDRAQVAILMLDAEEGLRSQDLKIASFIQDKAKASVIVVNKWDLMREKKEEAKAFMKNLRHEIPFLAYSPICFASAKTGLNVFDVLGHATRAAKNYARRVGTAELNRVIEESLEAHQPPVVKGRRMKIFFGSQTQVAPPIFTLRTNEPEGFHFSYQRYLVNSLRKAFDFEGSPIQIVLTDRNGKTG